jgi:hypothetical protein
MLRSSSAEISWPIVNLIPRSSVGRRLMADFHDCERLCNPNKHATAISAYSSSDMCAERTSQALATPALSQVERCCPGTGSRRSHHRQSRTGTDDRRGTLQLLGRVGRRAPGPPTALASQADDIAAEIVSKLRINHDSSPATSRRGPRSPAAPAPRKLPESHRIRPPNAIEGVTARLPAAIQRASNRRPFPLAGGWRLGRGSGQEPHELRRPQPASGLAQNLAQQRSVGIIRRPDSSVPVPPA